MQTIYFHCEYSFFSNCSNYIENKNNVFNLVNLYDLNKLSLNPFRKDYRYVN